MWDWVLRSVMFLGSTIFLVIIIGIHGDIDRRLEMLTNETQPIVMASTTVAFHSREIVDVHHMLQSANALAVAVEIMISVYVIYQLYLYLMWRRSLQGRTQRSQGPEAIPLTLISIGP